MLLITGGLGFIGSHTALAHLQAGEQVVASGLPSDTVPPILAAYQGKGLTPVVADIANPYAIFDVCKAHKIDSIIHLAGPLIGAVSPAEEMRQNTAGLLNILEAGRLFGMRRISMASSIAVYFGLESGPFSETAPARLEAAHTIEAYKKAEELMGLYYAGQTGVDLVALRLASIYGPGYRSRRHLPAQLVHAGVSGHKRQALLPPGVAPYHAGDSATDLCYVSDCADGIKRVHASTTLTHRSYNIGSGFDLTNADYLAAAHEIFSDLDYPLEPGCSSANWPHAVFDLSRVKADTGYAPQFDPVRGMTAYADWLRAGHAF